VRQATPQVRNGEKYNCVWFNVKESFSPCFCG
jgi:hypothetical protein